MIRRTFSRYVHIFSISMQDALQARSQSLLWFLYGLFNTASALLFWMAGFAHQGIVGAISLPYIQAYFVFMLVANSALMSHVEEGVAERDIKNGELVQYLLKPISYFWYKFATELPWGLMGGFFGLCGLLIIGNLIHLQIPLPQPAQVILIIVCMALTRLLSFTYKMLLSMSVFWMTEGFALFELMEVIVLILAGFVLPLSLLPNNFQHIAFALPFAYMIYLPVQALTGQLNSLQLAQGIGMQLVWIGILGLAFRFFWKKGIKLFTGVGQ